MWDTATSEDVELSGDLEHAHIEARGIDQLEPPGPAAASSALEQLDAVHWAEVNALISRVAVAFDGGEVDPGKLVRVRRDDLRQALHHVLVLGHWERSLSIGETVSGAEREGTATR